MIMGETVEVAEDEEEREESGGGKGDRELGNVLRVGLNSGLADAEVLEGGR